MKHHKKKSKRIKLSLKYNREKRVRESKRRIRKEAKKLGLRGANKKKDPGIPNTWPFKAEMLQELERQKEKKEQELADRRDTAKVKAKQDQSRAKAERRRVLRARDEERRLQRAELVEKNKLKEIRKALAADVILEVLDARDPLRCRCQHLEAWIQEKGKRLIFVLTKADCVSPQYIVQWLQALGKVGPVVAVQAEAGREGVADLLRMLGKSPKGAASAPGVPETLGALPEVNSVSVVGYPATGKKALCKAIRQECKAGTKWLLDAIGRLNPPTDAQVTATDALHLSMRGVGMQGKGAAWNPATATAAAGDMSGPLAAVSQLLERVPASALMRRFRLPAFASKEELLTAFAKDKNLLSKKGKVPAPEAVARRLLTELPAAPGCCCAPPAAETTLGAEASKMVAWPAHGEKVSQILRALMEAHASPLLSRDPGPCANALVLSSVGFGPAVDIDAATTQADDEAALNDGEAMDDDDDDDEDGSSNEDGLLEGEEEELEEEEFDEDDESMGDE